VRRPLAGVALLFLLALPLVAQTAKPALSRGERKERVRRLSEHYQQFLRDVEPIMQPEELDNFLRLESDPQREEFIDDFWHRRDTEQGIKGGGFKTIYYDRLQTAREKYRSASSDRGRIYVIHGPAASIFEVRNQACRLLQDMEIWTYDFIPNVGHGVHFIFYVPRAGFDYKLWQPQGAYPDDRREVISSQVVANSSDPRVNVADVFGNCWPKGSTLTHLECECQNVADQVLAALGANELIRDSIPKAFAPPEINKEAVKRILQRVVVPTPGAAKLATEVSVAYPFRQGERTDAQLIVLVPKSQLVLKEAAGTKLFSVDVIGEVNKDDKLFEHFRYRFDFPAGTQAEKLPVIVDRLLHPAEYVARLKVSDANANTEAIVETPLTVPDVAVRTAESAKVSQITSEIASSQTTLRILPLTDELLTGLQHIDTLVAGDVSAVEFSLDGRKIMTKRAPPYSLDVDLGSVPQAHRVRVVALNEKGETITGDEIVVNSGNEPFRVRIVSPRIAPKIQGRTRVEVAVAVPEGKALEKLEIFLNQARLATLYEAPFVQTIDIPRESGVSYLRAVATLKNSDLQPVEDVVMINTPQFMADVNVHLVELPTTVFRGGRPANDAVQGDFRVFDDRKPVTLAKFEHVSNLPLSVGLAIDTSQSMKPRMAEAQKAAAEFFADVLRGGDKAFVVSFDVQPQMARDWSPNAGDLNAALAKLRADESTALYDAVAYSLYNFAGVKGRRALVVVTDGADTSSKLSFDQTLEYARRAGVPIYGIGIGIGMTNVDVRYRFGRLCNEILPPGVVNVVQGLGLEAGAPLVESPDVDLVSFDHLRKLLLRRGIDGREALLAVSRDHLAADEQPVARLDLDVVDRLGRRRVLEGLLGEVGGLALRDCHVSRS